MPPNGKSARSEQSCSEVSLAHRYFRHDVKKKKKKEKKNNWTLRALMIQSRGNFNGIARAPTRFSPFDACPLARSVEQR
jgi:hypothetical protein